MQTVNKSTVSRLWRGDARGGLASPCSLPNLSAYIQAPSPGDSGPQRAPRPEGKLSKRQLIGPGVKDVKFVTSRYEERERRDYVLMEGQKLDFDVTLERMPEPVSSQVSH